jgi:hypothetical protein
MQRIFSTLSLATWLLLLAVPARADLLSVHADVPLYFSPSQEGADNPDSVSGARVGISLFVRPLGIAYEAYEVSYSSDLIRSEDTYKIVSAFVNLPVPVINIALGAGIGMVSGERDLSNGTRQTVDDSAATSIFATVGYPVLPLFDIHVGFQLINANNVDVKNSSGSITEENDPSGTIFTAGIKIGF